VMMVVLLLVLLTKTGRRCAKVSILKVQKALKSVTRRKQHDYFELSTGGKIV
jgi:hypothetical protein